MINDPSSMAHEGRINELQSKLISHQGPIKLSHYVGKFDVLARICFFIFSKYGFHLPPRRVSMH